VSLSAVLLLLVCTLGNAAAAPKSAAMDDPVRVAAARAIKKLDLQVSLPHPDVEEDDSLLWNVRPPP